MSDTGTFDAAINHLTNRLNSRGEGSEREELRQAIRVLEAAGNLHRGSCLMFMDDIELPIPPRVLDYKKVGDGIRALLEALPDGSRQESRQNGAVKE